MKLNKALPNNIAQTLGKYFEHRSDFDKAAKFYAMGNGGKTAEGLVALANVSYRKKDYPAAAQLFSDAVIAGADSELCLKRLAISAERCGRIEDAEKALKAFSERYPDDPEGNHLLAKFYLRHGEKASAREHFALLPTQERNKTVERDYMKTFDRRALPWQIVAAMERFADLHQKDGDWQYKYATAAYDSGYYEKAAEAFALSGKLRNSSWSHYRSGLAWHMAGQPRKAHQQYVLAQSKDKKLDARKWGFGVFHEEAKRWDLAADTYDRDQRSSAEMWRKAELARRAGRAYGMLVDWDSALRCYDLALSLRPLNKGWRWELLDIALQAGDYERVMKHSAVIEHNLHPTKELAKINQLNWMRGLICLEQGEQRQAIDFLRRSLAPSRPSIFAESETLVDAVDLFGVVADPEPENIALEGVVGWGGASKDRRGHEESAKLCASFGDEDGELRHLQLAALLAAPLSPTMALRLSELLCARGEYMEATRVLLRTRKFPQLLPEGFHLPKENSYTEKLAYYREVVAREELDPTVILYESNLGLSVDCNPLEICREVESRYPGVYTHVWSVGSGVSLPEDLALLPNVLTVTKDSLPYIRLLATAKYTVNNSTFPTYFVRRPGQEYLMTWHGTPLKTLGKDMPDVFPHLNMARNYLQASTAIFPNKHTESVLLEGCDIAHLYRGKSVLTGYPRNDALVGVPLRTDSPRPRVLYAPTWRPDDELASQVQKIRDMAEVAENAGYEFVVRAHHYVEEQAAKTAPEVCFVERSLPTNDLLPTVDILITDFSSIYFDFALSNRPIFFFVPDWDLYLSRRGTYFDQSHLPGPVINTMDELAEALESPTVDAEQRAAFNAEFGGYDDGRASARAVDLLFGLDNEPRYHGPHSERHQVLLRQSFIPNGMATSFQNLTTQLCDEGVEVTAITEGRPAQNDENRQETLSKVDSRAHVVGRVGQNPKNLLEYHVSQVATKINEFHTEEFDRVLDGLFEFEVKRVFGCAQFDTVIEFDGYSEFMARLVLGFGPECTKVIYLHNDIQGEIALRIPSLRGVVALLDRFDSVVSVSPMLESINREKLGDSYGIATDNFTAARNLILPPQIRSFATEEVDPEWAAILDGPEPFFVHVGRMSPEKNHVFLIASFARLVERHPNAKLVLLGDGVLRAEIEADIKARGLEDSVLLAGRISNPYPFISKARALLLPSLHEGQPMVILEARCLGTPVIGSDIGSIMGMGAQGASVIVPHEEQQWVDAMSTYAVGEKISDDTFDAENYVRECTDEFYAAAKITG